MTDISTVIISNCNFCTSLSAKVHWIWDYTISCYDESLTTYNFRRWWVPPFSVKIIWICRHLKVGSE